MATLGSWNVWLALLLQLQRCSWSWSWNVAPSYLDADREQRPLWILEDQSMKRQRVERSEAATTTRRMRQPLRIVVRPDAAPRYLPPRYLPQRRNKALRQPRNELRRRQQPPSLPVFDNAPGDNALSAATSYPIFVYNGTKGELLVNTMLSAQRYPMQEPVPGQVLYPPATPMFRPKPLVERFRVPKQQRPLLNLTLIPFYAHEAITLAPPTTTTTTTMTTTTLATTTAELSTPTATPEVATSTTSLPREYETQLAPSKRRRLPKKTRHYNAYRSPQEVVQRQPVLRSSPARAAPNNHRQQQQQQLQQDQTATATELAAYDQELQSEEEEEEQLEEHEPLEEQQEAEQDGDSSLQIVYADDSLEASPSTVGQQRQSSRYAVKREYFAFPVYTLGKLLQDPSSDRVKMGHIVELGDSSEPGGGDTWFILNSRYKGPHRGGQSKNQSKYYTSKYVQNPKGSSR